MDKTWTEADAQLLRDLRTASGMDRATFARRCTLSLGQLTELEEGGSGRFYSASIKSHTGRTLLAKLGHVRRVIEADRMDAPSVAPAPGPAPTAKAASASTQAPTPSAPSTPEEVGASASVAPSEPAGVALRSPGAREPVTDVAARSVAEPSAPRGKSRVGIVVVGVALIGALAWWNRPQPSAPAAVAAAAPEPVAEMAAAASEAPAAAASAPAVTGPASGAASAPASPAVPAAAFANAIAPAPAGSATAMQAKADAAACPPAGGTSASFTPERALKPGSYVYLEAQKATVVCVTDGAQKKSEVRIKAGERINVSGVPPFTVQAAHWADVRVFFQGVRVPLEDPGMSAGALLLQAR